MVRGSSLLTIQPQTVVEALQEYWDRRLKDNYRLEVIRLMINPDGTISVVIQERNPSASSTG